MSKYKRKKCKWCNAEFAPTGGRAHFCERCKTFCVRCGKRKASVGTFTKHCRSCAGKLCHPKTRWFCIDCGKELPRKRHKRCERCASVERWKQGIYAGAGWKRYKFNGQTYRSGWEVEAAKLLIILGIDFEYERKDRNGKYPDFYFPEIDMYLEIHPDYWGEKQLPDNAILEKTLDGALETILSVGLFVRPKETKAFIGSIEKGTSLARAVSAAFDTGEK